MQGLSLSTIGRLALDFIYPPQCVLCRKAGTFLCEDCIETLPRAGGLRCDRCWLPVRGRECVACLEHPSAVTRLRSVFRYEGGVRRIVHAFKFAGHSSLAPDLGRLLADAVFDHGWTPGAIVPVPLTRGRRRERGYNQALLMARHVASSTGAPVLEALRRTGHARTQAGSATADERRANVQGVFALANDTPVAGLDVLLIDDVATTGATLDACARVLLAGGTRSVQALTLARED